MYATKALASIFPVWSPNNVHSLSIFICYLLIVKCIYNMTQTIFSSPTSLMGL
jgi:hypothetical protein